MPLPRLGLHTQGSEGHTPPLPPAAARALPSPHLRCWGWAGAMETLQGATFQCTCPSQAQKSGWVWAQAMQTALGSLYTSPAEICSSGRTNLSLKQSNTIISPNLAITETQELPAKEESPLLCRAAELPANQCPTRASAPILARTSRYLCYYRRTPAALQHEPRVLNDFGTCWNISSVKRLKHCWISDGKVKHQSLWLGQLQARSLWIGQSRSLPSTAPDYIRQQVYQKRQSTGSEPLSLKHVDALFCPLETQVHFFSMIHSASQACFFDIHERPKTLLWLLLLSET